MRSGGNSSEHPGLPLPGDRRGSAFPNVDDAQIILSTGVGKTGQLTAHNGPRHFMAPRASTAGPYNHRGLHVGRTHDPVLQPVLHPSSSNFGVTSLQTLVRRSHHGRKV